MAGAVDFTEAERYLLEAEFEELRPIWSSSNYVYLARLCMADGVSLAAVYKPGAGETPLWDFPTGTLYRREVAAYRLSLLLGWHFIPPTVERDGPKGPGSLQVFIEHDPNEHFFAQREVADLVPQLQQLAAFDFVANNADRKGGHCLLGNGQVWGIDHGLCFHTEYKLRTVIWDWSEELIPDDWLDDVQRVADLVEGNAEEAIGLVDLLHKGEEAALLGRCRALLESRRFPVPGPHRSYPWPLI